MEKFLLGGNWTIKIDGGLKKAERAYKLKSLLPSSAS
jgi:hypothetical protein